MHARLFLIAVLFLGGSLFLTESGPADAKEAPPATSANDKGGNDVEALARRIDESEALQRALDAEMTASRQQRVELQDSLSQAAAGVAEREQRLADLSDNIQAFDEQLQRLDALVAASQAEDALRARQLASLVRLAWRQRRHGDDRPGWLQPDYQIDMARRSVYARYISKASHRALLNHRRHLQRTEAAWAQARQDRNWLDYLRAKATGQRDGHRDKELQTSRELAAIESTLAESSLALAQLQADQAGLKSLLEQLQAEKLSGSGAFADGKGQYDLPVAGQLQATFGQPKAVGKLTWEGWFIAAEAGQPVSAIANGSIVFSDTLPGYGRLVIIDHGDGYLTLYGGNEALQVAEGQKVDSGATLATTGNSGGQTQHGVYFEIRHHATPIDPKPWVRPTFEHGVRDLERSARKTVNPG